MNTRNVDVFIVSCADTAVRTELVKLLDQLLESNQFKCTKIRDTISAPPFSSRTTIVGSDSTSSTVNLHCTKEDNFIVQVVRNLTGPADTQALAVLLNVQLHDKFHAHTTYFHEGIPQPPSSHHVNVQYYCT